MPPFREDLDFGEWRENAFRKMVLDGGKIECKSDVKAFQYGNLAYEMQQRTQSGIIKPSGIALDNYKVLAHEIALDVWLVMPRATAIGVAEQATDRRWGGDNNNAFIHLVPMKDFYDFLRRVATPARDKS